MTLPPLGGLTNHAAFATDQSVESWWQASCPCPDYAHSPLKNTVTTEVAVIGGGYTGLMAAHRLTSYHHIQTHLIEAGWIGLGASGRNAGFCGLASSTDDTAQLLKRFGEDATREFLDMQYRAVKDVEIFLDSQGIDAQRHGVGETELLYRSTDLLKLANQARLLKEWLGLDALTLSSAILADHGMKGSGFSGGLYIPFGFGLNPLRYLHSLAKLAVDSGVTIHTSSPVVSWSWSGGYHYLRTPEGCVRATRVIVATNGYFCRKFASLARWKAAPDLVSYSGHTPSKL